MKQTPLIPLLLLIFLLSACGPAPASPGPDVRAAPEQDHRPRPVTVGVGFVPSVQFAPFYVGMKKGFFAEEGIDISLDYGFENDYLKLVGTDDLQFMVGSGDQVVLGRAQGLPIIYVGNWYTTYPVTVFAKADRNIAKPADLAGKTIGIPGPFGATYVALRGLLEAADLTEDDVQLESIGFTQSSAVSEDLVDAAVDYAVNGPVILAQEEIDTTQIAVDQYLQIPANGIVTNEATINAEPELVSGMVRGLLRSVEYTLANPDEAFEIALESVPEAAANRAVNRAVFDASLPYWQPRSGLPHGATTLEEWSNVASLMARTGLVDVEVPAEELYTNQFVPAMLDASE